MDRSVQKISAIDLDFKELNDKIRNADGDVIIDDCYGQRFIGSGLAPTKGDSGIGKTITINGTPGNALGAYLDGATIKVNGNAQDAVGDTMNDGRIVIDGDAGDALGYAMRGGQIFVKGNAGYRTGIHMKEYKAVGGLEKKPVIVVGGGVGSFLGEYLAGGLIVVLGIGIDGLPVGNFTGTGMHGGRIYIRTDKELLNLPSQVTAGVATDEDIQQIASYINEFSKSFNLNSEELLNSRYYLLTPNAKNPYKQLYTAN